MVDIYVYIMEVITPMGCSRQRKSIIPMCDEGSVPFLQYRIICNKWKNN